jgi:hypothetical protein
MKMILAAGAATLSVATAFCMTGSDVRGPSRPMPAYDTGEEKPAPAKEDKPAEEKYPIDTCVVTGEKLGAMGEPVSVAHEGRKVLLCCKGCVKKFNAEPKKYLKILDDEIAKKKAAK